MTNNYNISINTDEDCIYWLGNGLGTRLVSQTLFEQYRSRYGRALGSKQEE